MVIMRSTQKSFLVLYSIFIGFTSAAPGGYVAVGGVKPPIFLDAGNVGVNFAGFHAAAGLGGLLSGGAAGGLHAEAGTPYGQEAAAGLGGVVAAGKTAGGLYAAADSGAGAAAGAAIGGATSDSFAPVVVEKTAKETPQIQRTYVERTVIPNYVEKTIQVPSYVEKTVRVPTVVERRIKVPAAPTIIEKTVNAPPETVKTTEIRTSGLDKSFTGSIVASAGTGTDHIYSTGYGGGGAHYALRKTVNSNVVNDIFNIPISTLNAVNRLVGGLAGGTSGSLYVSKHVG